MINSREKGKKFELAVVNAAKAAGLPAERTAPMQAGQKPGATDYGDVQIAGLWVECKADHDVAKPCYWNPASSKRQNPNAVIRAALDSYSAMILKRNRCPVLVVTRNPQGVYHWQGLQEWLEGLGGRA